MLGLVREKKLRTTLNDNHTFIQKLRIINIPLDMMIVVFDYECWIIPIRVEKNRVIKWFIIIIGRKYQW